MEIILERSGAERAYLLAALDENVAVIACKESGDKARVFPSSQWPGPAAARKTSAPIRGYSEGIIRYALHSGVPIIIDDTEKDPLFSQYSFDDGYKPRSILCLTLPAQGGPTPVLYLDNNLATHGFSENSPALFAGSPSSSFKYWPQPERPSTLPRRARRRAVKEGARPHFPHGQRGSDPEFDGLRTLQCRDRSAPADRRRHGEVAHQQAV